MDQVRDGLATMWDRFFAWLPQLAAASVMINRMLGDTPTGKVSGAVLPVIIMSIATFMILEKLKIAPTIVTITYTGLVGSLFLGLALAFGLGGRDVAATILRNAYDSGLETKEQVKRDLQVGKQRAKRQAKVMRNRA